MHPTTLRIVHDDLPYLLVFDDDGAVQRAHGPFSPGTEPSLTMCTPENQVTDPDQLVVLTELAPLSPVVPGSKESLSEG